MGRLGFLAVLLTLGTAGCAGRETTAAIVPPKSASSIQLVSGNGQSGQAGQILPQQLTVRVVNDRGEAVGNAWVHFTTSSGIVSPDSVMSDSDGYASASWTLPVVSGSYIAIAQLKNLPSVTFAATVVSTSSAPVSQAIGSAGGTVMIPLGAYAAELRITPATFIAPSIVSLDLQAVSVGELPTGVEALTPFVVVSGPFVQSDSIIKLRVPVPHGVGANAVAYELEAVSGVLQPILILESDANWITIGIRSLALPQSGSSALRSVSGTRVNLRRFLFTRAVTPSGTEIFDTGFRPGVDDWEFTNVGSLTEPGGFCLGQTLSMAWYYTERRLRTSSPPLNNRYSRIPNFSEAFDFDNRLGWRLASVVQSEQDSFWQALGVALHSSDETTWRALNDALKLRKVPVTLAVRGDFGGHAVLVWKLEQANGKLWIADPNRPGNANITIEFDISTRRFKPYTSSQVSGGASFSYD